MIKKLLLSVALVCLGASAALGQSVQQSGTVTVGQAARWVSNGIIGTGGTAADGLITALGITNNGLSSFCISSARASAAGRQQMCFGVVNGGASVISVQNYGSQTAQDLKFNLNGTELTLPSGGGTFLTGTGVFTVGNLIKVNNASGVLQDAGISLATGTLNGIPYYSATTALTSLAAGTNGQMLVGTTSAAPNWRTLSGDVSAVSAAGAVTLQSVNGVTYPASYTANGVLYASSTTAVTNVGTANVGYCLLSQGSSSAPIWAACASGAGSAGGSDTQVQFNNSSSLGGSVNMTWVSPALRLGVSGTTSGQLQLNSSAGVSGAVTVQAPTATAAYNFNLPTGAGTTGQPLISGGGGATAMTFGTLGIAGGGTNCAVASGTCLDNIAGFSSTGFVQRTGAGTYAFSTTIPVSGGGTGLASGTSGGILGFTASGTITSSAELAVNGVVIGGGAGATPTTIAACTDGQLIVGDTSAAPACRTMSGDISAITDAGAVTIANSAISNAKLANAAAYTLKGNFTGSAAAPTDTTIGSLTQKASPAAGDYLLLADNAASGQMKYATVSSVASAGSVSSIAGNTGAFTLTLPITNATNAILLNATISPQGRVTLTTQEPVTQADVTAATTVYYAPYLGNLVPLYDGTNVIATSAAELSISLGTNWAANSNFDVFIGLDGATVRACTGAAWTNSTTRADSIGRTNGLWLNSGSVTCRYNNTTTFTCAANRCTYVGTFRTVAQGQTEDSFAKRFVFNTYNRVDRPMRVTEATNNWNYTTASFQQANASAANQLAFVRGLDEDPVSAVVRAIGLNSVGTALVQVGIGLDSSTTLASGAINGEVIQPAGVTTGRMNPTASWVGFPGLGYHELRWLEYSTATGTTTWYGDDGSPTVAQAGISGMGRM